MRRWFSGAGAPRKDAAPRRPVRPATRRLVQLREEAKVLSPSRRWRTESFARCKSLPPKVPVTHRATSWKDPGGLVGTKSAGLHPSILISQDRAGALASTPPSYHPLHPVSFLGEPWNPIACLADAFRKQKQRGNGLNSKNQVSGGEGSDHPIPSLAGKIPQSFWLWFPGGLCVVCPSW